MSNFFEDGYNYFISNISSYASSLGSANFGNDRYEYIRKINESIDKLEEHINSFQGTNTDIKTLKGDIAEFWHADTYNYNAAINNSSNRMNVSRSHDFASADVVGNDGSSYSMKYYNTAEASAKAQSTSIFERYKEYKSRGGQDNIEKYLSDRNFNDVESVINDPIYAGQKRIIPSDQLNDAVLWLKKKIELEKIKRPEQVSRYEETLKLLQDKISDSNGNESIALSEKEAKKLASLAKKGKFNAEDYGITAPEFLKFGDFMKESMKAGLDAAIISMVLKVGPEIYKTIEYLIKKGEINEEQFKKIGFSALSGASEGFVRGSIAASITLCCKSGMLGESFINIDPSIIGVTTVLAINLVKGSYEVAIGKRTRNELADTILKDLFVSTCSLIGGNIAQCSIHIPILGYLIGSFVGSLVGSFIYNGVHNIALSFCIDSGFTLFGLVEQDYKLPDDIINYIGIDVFKYDSFDYDKMEIETFKYDTFEPDSFELENIGITFLRRGVIGINKIGYI